MLVIPSHYPVPHEVLPQTHSHGGRTIGPVLQSTITPVTYNANSAVFRADYSIDSVTTSDSGTYIRTVTNPIESDTAIVKVFVTSKLFIGSIDLQ